MNTLILTRPQIVTLASGQRIDITRADTSDCVWNPLGAEPTEGQAEVVGPAQGAPSGGTEFTTLAAVVSFIEEFLRHPTPEEILAAEQARLEQQCGDHSQARLDGLAHSWGYDNITTLRSAALSSVPRFLAEGNAGQAAWDAEWGAAQAFLSAVLAGEVQPTFGNYVAALPALPARPTS